MPPATDDQSYSIRSVHRHVDMPLAEEIAAFWLANDAIADPEEAARRVPEVVCVARNAANEMVGLNSVYVSALGQPSDQYYFYRLFIRKQDRVPGLATRMTRMCIDHLRRERDSGIVGMALVTENAKLMKAAAQRRLVRIGWQYVGRGPLGRDVWKIDFDQSTPA